MTKKDVKKCALFYNNISNETPDTINAFVDEYLNKVIIGRIETKIRFILAMVVLCIMFLCGVDAYVLIAGTVLLMIVSVLRCHYVEKVYSYLSEIYYKQA